MSRLFEKTIRKKKTSLALLEWIPFTILSFIILLIVTKVYYPHAVESIERVASGVYGYGSRRAVGALGLFATIYVVSFIVWIKLSLQLFQSWVIHQSVSGKDVVFIDQTSKFALGSTFLYLYLTEPYIYRMKFLVDTFKGEPYTDTWERLHFNLPTSKTYLLNKNLNKYDKLYSEDKRKTNPKEDSSRFRNFGSQRKQGSRDWHLYTYYITFEKAQALNRVFDVVELPAFRIVVNENTRTLYKILPIEGREYPEEVYELLDKINAMYP